MRLSGTLVVVGLVLFGPWGQSRLTAWDGWHRFWSDWHRSNAWPEPYASQDRELAYSALQPFVDAGWQTETTLLDPLFDEQGQLTHAGKLRVREILTQYPANRRMLFVAPGADSEQTERRLSAVRAYIEKLPDIGRSIPVAVRYRLPRTGTGDYLNLVGQRYRQAMPAPVLPSSTRGTSNATTEGTSP